jgi:hypothetical protein
VHRLGHNLEARVSVLVRQTQQAAVGTDQAVVTAPGVDADGNDRVAMALHRSAQAFEDFPVKADEVPERAAGQIGAWIVETVEFLKFDFREIRGGGDDASAACSEVHCDEGFRCHEIASVDCAAAF